MKGYLMNSRMMDEDDIRGELIRTRKALAEMTAYADDLVAKIPFLPKDVDNLRDANLQFATLNHSLSIEKEALLDKIYKPLKQYERARIHIAVENEIGDIAVNAALIEKIVRMTINETQKFIISRQNDEKSSESRQNLHTGYGE